MILDGAEIGADCQLVARVTICHGVRIGERCVFAPRRGDRRRRLRPCAGSRRVREGSAGRHRGDRRRRRDRRQHDHRSRRHRRHGHRGRRQDRQPGDGGAQRAHRRAHRHRGHGRHRGQRDDRQAVACWAGRSGIVGHLSDLRRRGAHGQDDGQPHRSRSPACIPGNCRPTRPAASGATARASRSSTSWRDACAGSRSGARRERTKDDSDE